MRIGTGFLWRFGIAVALGTTLMFSGCAQKDDEDDETEVVPYQVEIRWTKYGIPHITASDWGSLGYGFSYAFAKDNFCLMAKEFVRANGESARYLGSEGNLNSDLLYKFLNTDSKVQTNYLDLQSTDMSALIAGYVAGYNRYLSDTGKDALAVECRDKEWVRPITNLDFAKVIRKVMVMMSLDYLGDYVVAAVAPTASETGGRMSTTAQSVLPPTEEKQAEIREKAGKIYRELFPETTEVGSNAYALGSQSTVSQRGMVLGNPHFPWQGTARFYLSHLTVTGIYDVMGVSLAGSPVINIGFNKDLAWSHTVSTGKRFTFFELKLNPQDPLQYEYDGVMQDFIATSVSAEYLDSSDAVQTQTHTFYETANGSIVLDLSSFGLGGWTANSTNIFAIRDVVLDNPRTLQQWIDMGKATDIAEFKTALRSIGIPWVNTIAADRAGTAFYGDISSIPNLTATQLTTCVDSILAKLLTNRGFVTVNGSSSACDWGGGDATATAYFGYDSLPKVTNTTYAANSNDSFWLANPDELLTGFSSVIGKEGVQQSLRTRLGFMQIEQRLNASDGLGATAGFTLDNLQKMLYGSRVLSAEMVLDDVATICNDLSTDVELTDATVDVTAACSVLANWDRTNNLGTVGSHVFGKFWSTLNSDLTADVAMWTTTFDATDPVHTPSGFNGANSTMKSTVMQSIAKTVQDLNSDGIALDASMDELQTVTRNGEVIPIHGGKTSGSFSIFSQKSNGDVHGNSYIQTVTWDSTNCPVAEGILTYSQATDPSSDHYSDQTKLYSQKGWIDFPFCSADVTADQVGETLVLTYP